MSKLKFQVKSHKLTVKKHLFAVFNKIFRPAKNYTAYGKKNQNTEFWIRCPHIIYSAFQPPSVGCGQEKDTEMCQSPTPASSCSQVSNHDTCSHAERPVCKVPVVNVHLTKHPSDKLGSTYRKGHIIYVTEFPCIQKNSRTLKMIYFVH